MSERARYYVTHDTRYEYQVPVGLSRHLVRLEPRELPWQHCHAHTLTVNPEPNVLSVGRDAFGNHVKALSIEEDHTSLFVSAASWVEITERSIPDDHETPAWNAVRKRLSYRAEQRPTPEDLDATRFLFESARVRNKRELAAWTLPSFPSEAPLLECVRHLMERIHTDFTFDPRATTVSTPVMEVFAKKRGVCQDYAHFTLSCLRSMGLAARYVSGYLLTHPPAGRPRLVGADASHAWVSVYCPDVGWVDIDPTNNSFPSTEHVTLGWGRDFDDVTPLRGVLLGGGEHEIRIAVTVATESEFPTLFGRPVPTGFDARR